MSCTTFHYTSLARHHKSDCYLDYGGGERGGTQQGLIPRLISSVSASVGYLPAACERALSGERRSQGMWSDDDERVWQVERDATDEREIEMEKERREDENDGTG